MSREPDIRCEWPGDPCARQVVARITVVQTPRVSGWLCSDHATIATAYHLEHGNVARVETLIRDPRAVAIMLGGITGLNRYLRLPTGGTLADLIAAHIAGDPAAASVALDLTEERGLDAGLWPEVEREWLRVGRHKHTWLPVIALVGQFRCTCGLYEHEYIEHRDRGAVTVAWVNGRRTLQVTSGHPVRRRSGAASLDLPGFDETTVSDEELDILQRRLDAERYRFG